MKGINMDTSVVSGAVAKELEGHAQIEQNSAQISRFVRPLVVVAHHWNLSDKTKARSVGSAILSVKYALHCIPWI